MAHVAALTSYPIKACAGSDLDRTLVTSRGLEHDRTFLVVDTDGGPRTQRRDPGLAAVVPQVVERGRGLVLRAPGVGSLTVEVRPDGTRFGDPFAGVDQGDDAADWFSTVLGAPRRLVRVPPGWARATPGHTRGTAAYADGCAVHLISTASLTELDRRTSEGHGRTTPADRFRANIVVDGWAEPHAEDGVRRVALGGALLGYAEDTVRCAVTMVDQVTGRRGGPEPLRTLATYRRDGTGGIVFGINLAVLATGSVAVGDPLVVGSWAAPAVAFQPRSEHSSLHAAT